MSRKIFTAIWGAALAVFAASLVFIMGVSYNYFTGVQMKQLHAETALAAQGVSLCGKDYFTGLSTGDYRVTWIDADGTVLFDTGADASRMENHLEREEIRQALQNGTGEARRYSPTLADRQLYAAQRLPDGTVLRLSVVQLALWSLVLGFAQPICLVALLALGLSFLLASRLTKKIVAPINAIDPDNPMQYYEKDEYRAVEPLLRRIAAQQAQQGGFARAVQAHQTVKIAGHDVQAHVLQGVKLVVLQAALYHGQQIFLQALVLFGGEVEAHGHVVHFDDRFHSSPLLKYAAQNDPAFCGTCARPPTWRPLRRCRRPQTC